jgi:hypothetical protein
MLGIWKLFSFRFFFEGRGEICNKKCVTGGSVKNETTKLFWNDSVPQSLQKNESRHSLRRVLQQVAAFSRSVCDASCED